jgi:hypothetical protein
MFVSSRPHRVKNTTSDSLSRDLFLAKASASAPHAAPGTVHRRGGRGTGLEDGSSSPPRVMARSLSHGHNADRSMSNVNRSTDSDHAGPLAAKHRRVVGGESVGNEYIPSAAGSGSGEIKLEGVIERAVSASVPSKPPLNPSSRALVEVPPAGPPPSERVMSEFARATNVIFEGYLDKKSQILGLWQKRYFVLLKARLPHPHAGGGGGGGGGGRSRLELRIYTKAAMSAWGMLPVQVCVCVRVSVCVCTCVCVLHDICRMSTPNAVSLSVCVCVSVCLCLYLRLCLRVCVCVCVCS